MARVPEFSGEDRRPGLLGDMGKVLTLTWPLFWNLLCRLL